MSTSSTLCSNTAAQQHRFSSGWSSLRWIHSLFTDNKLRTLSRRRSKQSIISTQRPIPLNQVPQVCKFVDVNYFPAALWLRGIKLSNSFAPEKIPSGSWQLFSSTSSSFHWKFQWILLLMAGAGGYIRVDSVELIIVKRVRWRFEMSHQLCMRRRERLTSALLDKRPKQRNKIDDRSLLLVNQVFGQKCSAQ